MDTSTTFSDLTPDSSPAPEEPKKKKRKRRLKGPPIAKKRIQWKRVFDPERHHKVQAERVKKTLATMKKPNGYIERKKAASALTTERIKKKVIESVEHGNKLPTVSELAVALDITPSTVSKHMKKINFSEVFEPMKAVMFQKTPQVISSLYKKVLTGDVQAIKLWMQLTGYVETKEVKQDTSVNVTVTKRVLTTPEEFKMLNAETLPPVENAEFEEEKDEVQLENEAWERREQEDMEEDERSGNGD